jgi:cell division GTPase FtsZ
MERDDARQGSDLPVWEDALAPLRLKLETEARAGARIKVIGVGGGGGNAVNRMAPTRRSAVARRSKTPTS